MGFLFEIITFITFFVITSIIVLYCWFQYKFSYWAKKGVIGPKPIFPFGNIGDVFKRKSQFFEPYIQSYWKYKDLPYVGMYFFHEPVLSINDPDLAKTILIKDFEYFQAHAFYEGGTGHPMTDHVFNLHGTAWKNLRAKMSPTFAPRTLKSMYPFIEEIACEAVNYIDMLQSNGESINFSDFYAIYTMEIIGSVGFGLKCNGFKIPDSEFYRKGIDFLAPPQWYRSALRFIAAVVPNIFDMLHIPRYDPELVNFYVTLVTETVKYREKHQYNRNDFLNSLIELKNETSKDNGDNNNTFTINKIIANTLLYMVAGFDTSAAAGQLAAYHLAIHPDMQKRARDEVKKVLAKYNGECTYEAQNEIVYLNMVLDETMRLYPSMRALFRKCTKEYVLPNTNIVIEEGTRLFIPIHGIQKDPEIFPNPEKFDPERFTPENKSKLHPCHWMPFGEGPRKCLGLRQGYIQSKMALIKIIDKYELQLDSKTQVPLELNTTGLSLTVKNGIWIRLKPLSI